MNVLLICCTFHRFSCLKRALKCYIDQDYPGDSTLFIYNSGREIRLPELSLPQNKKVVLVNTTKRFDSVGEKYNNALEEASLLGNFDIVNSWDDDDLRLPTFISDGVEGMVKARTLNMRAYKSLYSYFRQNHGEISLMNNVMEPSIFVDYEHIKEKGYGNLNVKYHDSWLHPLIGEHTILADHDGRPSFIYNWGGDQSVFKMSGGAETPERYIIHQVNSTDTGEKENYTLSPSTDEEIAKYYNEIKEFNGTQVNN